jgi:D-alanyl-D-alanine dipeptidase
MVGRVLRAGLRIREQLGETPLGPLYRAEYPTGLEVEVLILASTSVDSVESALLRQRFRHAIEIQHPNVAAIYDLSETHDGLIYVVAERLTGELLSKTLARRGALPLEEALDLCLQAAAGLQAAHNVRWVHGSLSPDTILLTPTVGGHPLVKLIGFSQESLLRQREAEPPADQGVNPEYASPERIAGHPPDERSDVFSLGAVLHHLLTGGPPNHDSGRGRVPEAMRAVLNRALAPSPARRFQTVAEFAAALASQEKEAAAVIPEAARARGRRAFALGTAAVVAVATGLWLIWGTQRPGAGAVARARSQESGSVPVVEHDSISASARLPAASRPAARVRRDSAAAGSLLVDVRSVDSTIQVDLRYATANNFTGAPLPGYEAPRALLRREVATALGRVQAQLRNRDLGLRIFDAYRPVRASLAMVDWAERTGQRELLDNGYIARRTRHNLGTAVDVTLVDLKTGNELPMGSAFDSPNADAHTANASDEVLRNRQVLVRAMESEGFTKYDQAWWHFNFPLEGAVPLDRVIR